MTYPLLLSSLVGWLLWLRERGRRIAAEARVNDVKMRHVLGIKHAVLSRQPRFLRSFSTEPQPKD